MTDIPELKPCPFCGGEPIVERQGDRRQSHIIYCGECGGRLETGETWNTGQLWNTRTEPQVRPLVWVKHPTAEIWRCYTIIGQYMVFTISAPTWEFDGINDRTTRTALNETEAKAAAQADYTRRILSALA